MDFLYPLSTLSDRSLLDALTSLVSDKRVQDAKLLAHVAEVDRRKLYAPEGYSSMFEYCVRALHLSEAATYKRITTARAARSFPQIFDKLARGEIHHTGLSLLAPKLTAHNCEALLAAATHKTKRQIEELLAERFPKPDVPTRIVTLPRKRPATPVPVPAEPTLFDQPQPTARPPKPPTIEPLAPRRYKVELTASQALRDKIERAQALLRHRSPQVDIVEVVDRALDALLTQLDKQKYAATDKPRKSTKKADPASRYTPAELRRHVLARDGERCAFVSDTGHRCESTAFLEFDHIMPRAVDGQTTPENIRLLCRSHNQYMARKLLGPLFARERRAAYRSGSGASRSGARSAARRACAVTARRDVTNHEPFGGGLGWGSSARA